MQFTWEKYAVASIFHKNLLCVPWRERTQARGLPALPSSTPAPRPFNIQPQLPGMAEQFHTALCPARRHTGRGVVFHPRSFARAGHEEAGEGQSTGGCETCGDAQHCSCLCSCSLKLLQHGQNYHCHCHLCEGWHLRVQTLDWVRPLCSVEGVFERGVHGADPPSRVATASHRQGRAAAPPRATQAPRGCAAAMGPLRNVPRPTRWLCTLPPATLPAMGPPFSPKEKTLAVGLRRQGKLSHRDIAVLAATTTASACCAGPQSWTGKGEGGKASLSNDPCGRW